MQLDRFKAPALAATAVLLISGAASAFAASPASTTAAAPVAPVAQEKAAGPDTDNLQVGDQTTPDVAPAAAAAPAAHIVAAAPAALAAAPAEAKAAAETTETADAAETPEAKGTEADGPGGHADTAGQNVDHQFNGEE